MPSLYHTGKYSWNLPRMCQKIKKWDPVCIRSCTWHVYVITFIHNMTSPMFSHADSDFMCVMITLTNSLSLSFYFHSPFLDSFVFIITNAVHFYRCWFSFLEYTIDLLRVRIRLYICTFAMVSVKMSCLCPSWESYLTNSSDFDEYIRFASWSLTALVQALCIRTQLYCQDPTFQPYGSCVHEGS